MKKIYGVLVLVLGVVLLTGCGGEKSNGFKCTATAEEDGQKAEVTFDVTTDDDGKVKTADVTFDYESKDYADRTVSTINFINAYYDDENKIEFKQDGKKIIIKNYEKLSALNDNEDDEDSIGNIVGLTKDELQKAINKMPSASNVSCK